MRRINQIEEFPIPIEFGYMSRNTTSAELHTQNEQLKRRIKHLEDEAAKLEARNAELDAFAHTVAHDLRTPLSWVNGYSELLIKDWEYLEDEDRIGYAQATFHGAQMMSNIVDELLLLASLKNSDIVFEPIKMESIVRRAKVRLAPMLKEYNAQLSLPSDFPTVNGYGPWIEGVWVNYISNAIKYGGTPPEIEVGFQENRESVCFWVKDNGMGLTREEQTQLFVPFGGVDKEHERGHGLGLSIVRRIVEKLGGCVDIFSTLGEGSRFIFTLPRA